MNDPTKRSADGKDRDVTDEADAPKNYERVDADDVVEDAIELMSAGADDEQQVAEPIDDEPGPIPNA